MTFIRRVKNKYEGMRWGECVGGEMDDGIMSSLSFSITDQK